MVRGWSRAFPLNLLFVNRQGLQVALSESTKRIPVPIYAYMEACKHKRYLLREAVPDDNALVRRMIELRDRDGIPRTTP